MVPDKWMVLSGQLVWQRGTQMTDILLENEQTLHPHRQDWLWTQKQAWHDLLYPCRQEGHLKCSTWSALPFYFICTSASVHFFCPFSPLNVEKKHLKMKCNIRMKRCTRSAMMCRIRAHFSLIWVYTGGKRFAYMLTHKRAEGQLAILSLVCSQNLCQTVRLSSSSEPKFISWWYKINPFLYRGCLKYLKALLIHLWH